jgi:hypothetical protein
MNDDDSTTTMGGAAAAFGFGGGAASCCCWLSFRTGDPTTSLTRYRCFSSFSAHNTTTGIAIIST